MWALPTSLSEDIPAQVFIFYDVTQSFLHIAPIKHDLFHLLPGRAKHQILEERGHNGMQSPRPNILSSIVHSLRRLSDLVDGIRRELDFDLLGCQERGVLL